MALYKTEGIAFHVLRRAPPLRLHMVVWGTHIAVKPTLKYLGLVLDSRWNFSPCYRHLAPKLLGVAGPLSTLLPNGSD